MPEPDATLELVAFPFHDWRKSDAEGIRTRDGHVLQCFAQHPAVKVLLIVDRPISLAERLRKRAAQRAEGFLIDRHRVGTWRGSLTRVGGCAQVLDIAVPDVISVGLRRRGWWFDVFADRRMSEMLTWAMSVSGIASPAAIAWTPTAAAALAAIHPRRTVFDSLDNWLIHPVLRTSARDAANAYARVLPGATAVFASAPASAAVLRRWRHRVEILPNGVDPDRFSRPGDPPVDLPSRPIVGYAGKLAERIDLELVETVARSIPAAEFVFVGPVMDRSVRRLRALGNVALLGDRPPSLLPSYLSRFDVSWIPHRVGHGETGGDPIKLYEYWAAGRQVVTTAIDGAETWTDRAFVVRSPTEAIATIRGLLDGTTPPKQIYIEPERTWEAIAQRLLAPLSG